MQLATTSAIQIHGNDKYDNIGDVRGGLGVVSPVSASGTGILASKSRSRPSICRRNPSLQHKHFQLPTKVGESGFGALYRQVAALTARTIEPKLSTLEKEMIPRTLRKKSVLPDRTECRIGYKLLSSRLLP